MKNLNVFLSIFVLFIIISMIINPSLYIQQTLNGITAWAIHVLPSVFPFMFFTKILTSLGTIEKYSKFLGKTTNKLFKTPASSSFVFLTSIVSGYPVGAKMTADLYQRGEISKSDSFKMCSFCSTSGPMFIVGTVGVGMLYNATYGYIILISHILGAILNGMLYRNIKVKEKPNLDKTQYTHTAKHNDLSSIILDSSLSIISVGAIIAIFFVIITALSPIFTIFPPQIVGILEGFVEITKGCSTISTTTTGIWSVIACTSIISFGGISTILQSITMLNKLNMPIWLFILQKFSHAILSTLISLILVLILL